MPIGFTVRGNHVSLGFIIALVVFVVCIVLWVTGGGNSLELGLIAALAIAFLLG